MKMSKFQSDAISALREMYDNKFCAEYKKSKSDVDDYFFIEYRELKIFIYIDQFDIFKNGKIFDKVELQDVGCEEDLLKSFCDSMENAMS